MSPSHPASSAARQDLPSAASRIAARTACTGGMRPAASATWARRTRGGEGRRAAVAVLGALAWLGVTTVAGAQSKVDADYDRAVAEMVARRYEAACPIIEEVYRLDPRPGVLFTLAECEAGRGHIASAVMRYDEYLAVFAQMAPDKQAKQMGRERIALTMRAQLAPHVPQLTLHLPMGASLDTVVKRDGVVVPTLGAPFPVDPGEHVVTSQAPGEAMVEIRVKIAPDEKKDITLTAPPPRVDMPLRVPWATTGPTPPPPPPPTGPSAKRVAGYVVGSAGVAGVVVGAVLGGLVLAKKGIAADQCMGRFCTPEGADAVRGAKPLGAGSTAAFVVGATGLGVATVLLLTDRPATRGAALPAGAVGLGLVGEIR